MTRRMVVTGVDAQGRSTIAGDEPVGDGMLIPEVPGWSYAVVGATAPDHGLQKVDEPDPIDIGMPPGATHFAIWRLPPDAKGGNPAGMHRTSSVDYVVILEGAVTMVMGDGSEVELHAGDCVVQNGTRHAWQNRTGDDCVMCVVVVATRPA